MDYSIVDMESDGLLDTITKIHCVSVHKVRGDKAEDFTLTDYKDISEFIENEPMIIGHNIIKFDIRAFKMILGVIPKGKLIDTLALSWYTYPTRNKHGLAEWGEDLGIEKPKIEDWTSDNIEAIKIRCQEDVKINTKLWDTQANYLYQLYDGNTNNILRLAGYLTWKLQCAVEQEEVKWKLDEPKCRENLIKLQKELETKTEILRDTMPEDIDYKLVARPKSLYKKDGDISVAGEKWLNLLAERGLPDYHMGTLKVETNREKGNPNSHIQIKDWLFSLGWVPDTFNIVKDKEGGIRKVPQISTKEGNITDSIVALYEKNPELVNLDSYFVTKHRIGILEGFLEEVKNGYLMATSHGFTNTLRFTHSKPLTNIPTVMKAYGELIRECLIAPSPEHVLCGADVAGLEDSTKHHYMWVYDPEYVTEMRQKGYDPHIDIAMIAKIVTKEEAIFYKWYKSERKVYDDIVDQMYKVASDEYQKTIFDKLSKIRDAAKKSNFAAVYGAGGAKIALTANIPLEEANIFHKAYWKRNWSVKRITNSCIVKKMYNGQMWLWNPVSQFWYSLKVEKDKFSTLNQGTGVYVFDTWVRKLRNKGIRMCGQFHDEVIFPLFKSNQEEAKRKVEAAMEEANQELQLNIKVGVSTKFGENYATIH